MAVTKVEALCGNDSLAIMSSADAASEMLGINSYEESDVVQAAIESMSAASENWSVEGSICAWRSSNSARYRPTMVSGSSWTSRAYARKYPRVKRPPGTRSNRLSSMARSTLGLIFVRLAISARERLRAIRARRRSPPTSICSASPAAEEMQSSNHS